MLLLYEGLEFLVTIHYHDLRTFIESSLPVRLRPTCGGAGTLCGSSTLLVPALVGRALVMEPMGFKQPTNEFMFPEDRDNNNMVIVSP